MARCCEILKAALQTNQHWPSQAPVFALTDRDVDENFLKALCAEKEAEIGLQHVRLCL